MSEELLAQTPTEPHRGTLPPANYAVTAEVDKLGRDSAPDTPHSCGAAEARQCVPGITHKQGVRCADTAHAHRSCCTAQSLACDLRKMLQANRLLAAIPAATVCCWLLAPSRANTPLAPFSATPSADRRTCSASPDVAPTTDLHVARPTPHSEPVSIATPAAERA